MANASQSVLDDPFWGPYIMRAAASEAKKLARRVGRPDLEEDMAQEAAAYIHQRYRKDPEFRAGWNSRSDMERRGYLGLALRGTMMTLLTKESVVPRRTRNDMRHIAKARKAIAAAKGITEAAVTVDELVDALQLPAQRIQETEERFYALSSHHSTDDAAPSGDILPFESQNLRGEKDDPVDESLSRFYHRKHVARVIEECLTDREKFIIQKRYWDGLTLLAVGELLGLTKERVRQIELEAKKKIRTALRKEERVTELERNAFAKEKRRSAI